MVLYVELCCNIIHFNRTVAGWRVGATEKESYDLIKPFK